MVEDNIVEERIAEKDMCTYFRNNVETSPNVGYVGNKATCDNYGNCSCISDKFESVELSGEVAFCKINAAKNPQLEEQLMATGIGDQEINLIHGVHKDVKPMDPGTGNTKPYAKSD